jgi:hypothetical protein
MFLHLNDAPPPLAFVWQSWGRHSSLRTGHLSVRYVTRSRLFDGREPARFGRSGGDAHQVRVAVAVAIAVCLDASSPVHEPPQRAPIDTHGPAENGQSGLINLWLAITPHLRGSSHSSCSLSIAMASGPTASNIAVRSSSHACPSASATSSICAGVH